MPRAVAEVVINEVMAAASDRLLRWDANGVPYLGGGTRWSATAYDDASWAAGAGPFGYGTLTNSPAAIATNLATQMQNLTPSVYLRKAFTVSAGDAARTDALQFSVECNDGFVAYLNGVESATTLAPPNTAENPALYNAPMQSGKPAERPVAVEMLHSGTTADLRSGAGLRAAGSPYSRDRYILTNHNSATPNSLSPWTSSSTEKPQINLFFRDELGESPLNYPLVPGSVVAKYENIRLRSGKNDITNPFIRDEFARRLFLDMGQVGVRGDFVNLYVNSVFKGYFNICERPREPFF